jgi:hypothetical protein
LAYVPDPITVFVANAIKIFIVIPPVLVAAATFPFASQATAPTVPNFFFRVEYYDQVLHCSHSLPIAIDHSGIEKRNNLLLPVAIAVALRTAMHITTQHHMFTFFHDRFASRTGFFTLLHSGNRTCVQ